MKDEFQSKKVSTVQNQLKHLQQTREAITRNLKYTQIILQKYYNKKHHLREFYKEDFVLLNIKNLQTLKFSKKLLHKYIRLFCVKELVETQIYHLLLSISY